MITRISDYIVSPLAMGTHENYECVRHGISNLRRYEGLWGLPDPFTASRMDDAVLLSACRETGIADAAKYTRFELMAILAAAKALQKTNIDPSKDDVLFIIASTKGNVELLYNRPDNIPESRIYMTEAARQITSSFRNPNMPLIVCNACISGLSAQIEAARILASGRYKYAIVLGVDVLSPFVVSGFQSLKAMSDKPCRPFDEERTGLNLGEAAACIIYTIAKEPNKYWCLYNGIIRNDAFHLSGVSKQAEGAYLALQSVCKDYNTHRLAFINVHGTATMFNDEMEAVAIDRMKLNDTPIYGLKGYYGHTMGAAGVLETLISMEAVDDGTVPATLGFDEIGVSRSINISYENRTTHNSDFIKMVSGFGGCNAAALFSKDNTTIKTTTSNTGNYLITHTVKITEKGATIDSVPLHTTETGIPMLKELYRAAKCDYPKFHKMDSLGKLGFIASELLLNAEAQAENTTRFTPCADRAVVLAGRSASICTDRIYQQSIQDRTNYYPSPAAFIYTLPNIVTGEISIRNDYHGETSYFVQETPENVEQLMAQCLQSSGANSVIGGWIDIEKEDKFEANLIIMTK